MVFSVICSETEVSEQIPVCKKGVPIIFPATALIQEGKTGRRAGLALAHFVHSWEKNAPVMRHCTGRCGAGGASIFINSRTRRKE